jgi:hypothetical protein
MSIAAWSPVQEILDRHQYDVTAGDGEVIGTEIPAWVARVITVTEPTACVVRVHPRPRYLGT